MQLDSARHALLVASRYNDWESLLIREGAPKDPRVSGGTDAAEAAGYNQFALDRRSELRYGLGLVVRQDLSSEDPSAVARGLAAALRYGLVTLDEPSRGILKGLATDSRYRLPDQRKRKPWQLKLDDGGPMPCWVDTCTASLYCVPISDRLWVACAGPEGHAKTATDMLTDHFRRTGKYANHQVLTKGP